MADDLGYGDLGVYGQPRIKTPHIDSLAHQGMLFTQHYAGSTVCAPSRSALMTGLHTGHTRVRGNAHTPLHIEDTTLAMKLHAAGYRTALVGKWGLGDHGTTGIPNKKGFDYCYGFLNQTHAHNSYPAYVWENDTRDTLDNVVETIDRSYAKGIGGVALERHTYIQDKFMEKAMQFINQNKDTTFFLYLAITIPHANNEAKRWNLPGMEVPNEGIYKTEDWPEPQKNHAAMISYLDKDVGRLMAQLKSLGLDDHTLVIFTSDNGPHAEGGADPAFFDSNGPLKGIKRDLYEGGIRVPFIARWPGMIKAGSQTDYISAFWDIMPTVCELAQVTPPTHTDGISLLPTLTGNPDKQPQHDYLYWEFFEQGGKQAIRMGDWKYITLNVDDSTKTESLLFNLASDLGEEHNVAADHPDIVARAQKMMAGAHTYSSEYHFAQEKP